MINQLSPQTSVVEASPRTKSIAIFTTWFDSNGGAEKALRRLVAELSKDYSVTVVILNPKFTSSYSEQQISDRLTRINGRTRALLRSFSLPSIRNIVAIMRRIKNVDCIFVHQYYTFSSLLGAICSYVYGTPMILKPIAPIPTEYPPTSFFLRILGRIANRTICFFVLRQSSLVVPTSNYEKNYIQHLGIREGRIAIVPSGIHGRFLEPKSNLVSRDNFRTSHGIPLSAQMILYVGRVHEMKGIDQVIRAFPLVLRSCKKAYFVLAGNAEDNFKNTLLRLAKESNVADRVVFLGYLEGENLVECYSSADVFVNPSYMEAAPLAVREALAVGLPIVATDVGGTSEFLDSPQVRLVPPGDPVELSSALIDSLEDGKQRVRKTTIVSWETYVSTMREIFDRVCDRRNKAQIQRV